MEHINELDGNIISQDCLYYKALLIFDHIQQTRVSVTFFLFLLSTFGNLFVLYCMLTNKKRSHVHLITIHMTFADLVFTIFIISMDGIWNITMSWKGGEFLCKFCQMMKQFSMYLSSAMVVVIALDRTLSILKPMTSMTKQKQRTCLMLTGAWTLSLLSSLPAVFLFSVTEISFCEGDPLFPQCVDFVIVPHYRLKPYYFFTMAMSFLIPFILSIVSYSLVLYEINNMQRRSKSMYGERDSRNCVNIAKAKKKAFALMTLITFSFIILWTPYYGMGIYSWFNIDKAKLMPKKITVWIFILLYVHPTVHPIIYGFYMKDVRKKLIKLIGSFCKCTKTDANTSCKTKQKTDYHLNMIASNHSTKSMRLVRSSDIALRRLNNRQDVFSQKSLTNLAHNASGIFMHATTIMVKREPANNA